MKLKHIVLLLLVGLLAVSAVSAEDNVKLELNKDSFEPFDADTKITIDDIDFTVPKGFGEFAGMDFSDLTGFGQDADGKIYVNDDFDMVTIGVVSDIFGLDMDSLDDEDDYTKETINNHEGYIEEDDGFYNFIYENDDGKGVIISASDKNLIEEVTK